MTLTQLRFLREIARRGFSISAAANALHTSQPAVTRQIQQLEAELGLELLVRRGNRIGGFTDAGQSVLAMAERLLREADNIRAFAAEQAGEQGHLILATSHLHARFTLARAIIAFSRANPAVTLQMRQVEPDTITSLVAAGEVDVGVSTERAENHPSLVFLPLGTLRRSLIMSPGHPLTAESELTLADIARFPLVGYGARSRTGEIMASTFHEAGLTPHFVVSGSDADVIKVYVAAGLGVGIVPTVALDGAMPSLVARDVTHLLPETQTVLSLRRDTYLRRHVATLIRTIAPQWDRAAITAAMAG